MLQGSFRPLVLPGSLTSVAGCCVSGLTQGDIKTVAVLGLTRRSIDANATPATSVTFVVTLDGWRVDSGAVVDAASSLDDARNRSGGVAIDGAALGVEGTLGLASVQTQSPAPPPAAYTTDGTPTLGCSAGRCVPPFRILRLV